MSDRKWSQDVWSVLMDDGTEFLNVPINQADKNRWPPVAQKHGWTTDEYRGYGVQFFIWAALKRRGDIGAMDFPYFLDHIADWDKEDPAEAGPTPPGT